MLQCADSLGKYWSTPVILKRSGARILSQEQDQRIVADYSIQIPIDKEAADDLIENAEKFLERIRTYLQLCGVELRAEKIKIIRPYRKWRRK